MKKEILLAMALAASALAQTRFERDVLPIFTAKCFSCHGGTAMVGLDLRTAISALRGSHQGPVIVKGSAEKSLLYQKVSSRLMPPPAFNLKLSDGQIDTIKSWIDAGAPSDEAELSATRFKTETAKFDNDALPILKARCLGCHGAGKPMAGLDLRTLESVLKGSASGPVIEAGAADKSILIRKVSNGEMPPKAAGGPLEEGNLRTLRRWIDTMRLGARETVVERTTFTKAESPDITEKDRQWWSFRKPVKQAAPAVRQKARMRTTVDAFVLAKLEAKGLTFAADAPKRALLRRASFDLTGLPPTPQETEQFLADARPGAYERLIDRLLESQHFGERWARNWLDPAGYSDVTGFDNDLPGLEAFDGIWRYRDYVARAFNNDKPYDRFLVEQLAGDELTDWRTAAKYTPEMLDSLIATGYLRSVYDRTDADIVNLVGERHDVLFDLMEKVSTGIMGLTVGCARCHTHRYDPIPQRDYYRMFAVFTPAYNPMNWKQPKKRFLADVAKTEEEAIKQHNAEIERSVKEIQKELTRLRKPHEDVLFEAKLGKLPEGIRADTKVALETPADKRDDVQKFLALKFEKMLKVAPEEVDKVLKEDERTLNAKFTSQIKTLEGYKRKFEKVQALWDVGAPPVTRLLQRGQVESPGPRVQPGALTVLGGTDLQRPADAKGESSGMRLAFAKWLSSREHPLTARVWVNRVWMHLAGRGIVETPDNFGKMGAPPTHPELLDWLAVDFMENAWSTKRLIRTIVTSTVYRQASGRPETETAAARNADPENKLLWRMNLKRLDAEEVRDGVLVASGKLDRTVGGPPVPLKARPDGLQELTPRDSFPTDRFRRGLYIMSRRNWPLQFMQVFDFPTIQINCTRRLNSATPLQALAMLNDEFIVEQAGSMAERLVAESESPEVRITAAYLSTLERKPDAEELKLAQEHLRKQQEVFQVANAEPAKASRMALASLCQVLFSSNEFLYLD